MAELKLRRVGNSISVVIPKDILGRLKLQAGDSIFLTESPEGYRLTPYDPEFERQFGVAEKIMKQDRAILRELAK